MAKDAWMLVSLTWIPGTGMGRNFSTLLPLHIRSKLNRITLLGMFLSQGELIEGIFAE